MRRREAERIRRLEQNGTMNRRRCELREWFAAHPDGTPAQAVSALGYSHPDHMYVVADSIRIDITMRMTDSPAVMQCQLLQPNQVAE
jgi:hypothetical protein